MAGDNHKRSTHQHFYSVAEAGDGVGSGRCNIICDQIIIINSCAREGSRIDSDSSGSCAVLGMVRYIFYVEHK